MTKIQITIKRIIASRDERETMRIRQAELVQMVDKHGLEAVIAATGLKESTVCQYLRDKSSRISLSCIEQAKFVFAHPTYIAAKNNQQ